MAEAENTPDSRASRGHILVPPEFPIPRGSDQWSVIADWWDENGNPAKAATCRRIAHSLALRQQP